MALSPYTSTPEGGKDISAATLKTESPRSELAAQHAYPPTGPGHGRRLAWLTVLATHGPLAVGTVLSAHVPPRTLACPRMTTDYHAAYWASALSVQGVDGSIRGLSRSIGSARVDLNPHQIDAALFALRSPFTRGVLLADEVGLGKTIEAGIVIAQRWAERKRRVLLIVPATLRKQWQAELASKFGLPLVILDGPSLRAQQASGAANPLDRADEILIVSYPFAASFAHLVQRVPWDLVVADEAHRLRNVYQPSSKQAAAIKNAVAHAPKLLLTATPLQNSLLELYGLVSVLDDHAFGDVASFREQFMTPEAAERGFALLRDRLRPFCSRTLRRQVQEYVRFTRRIPLTQSFVPSRDEQDLYDAVSAFLQRDALVSLPSGQRALMTLVLRKLLASSSFAIAGTLRRIQERLEADAPPDLGAEDYEAVDELEEEWVDDGETESGNEASRLSEVEELRALTSMAERITANAKGDALLDALPVAFEQTAALGAARKAVVFTESRRTQRYLFRLLEENGYPGEIVMINGDNRDSLAREVYDAWKVRHPDQVSGTRAADVKAAIVDHFREHATVLLATESAAEGVNLQFCSLVVNYDLPWNPQRVEQRIGRCHRYGQKHDVVVVNFLNEANAADQRVFELLSEKFKLFEGVFGASDEVLGALETGIDLERRIAQVYQACRSTEEITAAFDGLQAELDGEIQNRMGETRQSVLDHLDQDLHARLKVHHDTAQAALDERQRWLFALTQKELNGDAAFLDGQPRFRYRGPAMAEATYNFDWRAADRQGDVFYAEAHPLAAELVARARARRLPPARLVLDLDHHPSRIAALEPLRGMSGWLSAAVLRIDAAADDERMILAGCTDDGLPLDADQCRKLLDLAPDQVVHAESALAPDTLASAQGALVGDALLDVERQNARFFEEESNKLDRWADDLKLGLEAELKDLDRQIREATRAARAGVSLQEKLDGQKRVRTLESHRVQKRRRLYDAQDEVDRQRETLIASVESRLHLSHTLDSVFTLSWTLT